MQITINKVDMTTRQLFIFLITLFSISNAALAQFCTVFPQPQQVISHEGVFVCPKTITIQESPASNQAITYLKQLFSNDHALQLELNKQGNSNIQLKQIQTLVFSEAYELTVKPSGIEITYSSYEGLLNAMQTLNQLITKEQTIPAIHVVDQPAYSYRGLHLDCSRHFFTIAEIKGLMNQLAKLKINRFHWHLTDDQGWRIEIKQYPKLTSVGAWRDSTLIGHYSKVPIEYEKNRYGGFYTQEEAKDLVNYAKERGIEIVPEIEMPGHASAAIAAYPELSCSGKQIPVAGTWGVFDDVFCAQQQTRDFLKNVLKEIMPIFPYPVIHIGGDECPKTAWNACEKCQAIIQSNHLKDAHELQSFFIKDIEKFVNANGKKIIGWDEILEGGLAPNAQVMSWRGPEGGIEAARAKHEAVMTPTSHCYFDYYQSGHPSEPLAIGGYVPLEKVYRFNPSKGIEPAFSKYILGGQANLWTEYIPTFDRVEYHLFPRLVAMSEVLWNNAKVPYEIFVQQLADIYLPQLAKDQINYATSFLDPSLLLGNTQNGLTYVFQRPIQEVSFYMNGTQKDSIFIQKSSSKLIHKIEVEPQVNQQKARPCNFVITSHLALGKRVKFITPPSEKYNHNGELGLTNGIIGSIPWKGNEWLGFDNDTVQFILDLEKQTKFNTIELVTLDDPGSWIYRPLTCKLETSKDGKTFKQMGTFDVKGDVLTHSKKTKATYVRVTLVNHEKTPAGLPGAGYTPWTFVSELILTK